MSNQQQAIETITNYQIFTKVETLNKFLGDNYSNIIDSSFDLYVQVCNEFNTCIYKNDDHFHMFSDIFMVKQRYSQLLKDKNKLQLISDLNHILYFVIKYRVDKSSRFFGKNMNIIDTVSHLRWVARLLNVYFNYQKQIMSIVKSDSTIYELNNKLDNKMIQLRNVNRNMYRVILTIITQSPKINKNIIKCAEEAKYHILEA